MKIVSVQGRFVAIDDVDLLLFKKYEKEWFCDKKGYIVLWDNKSRKTLPLHSFIMGFPQGKSIDHLNGNVLDNTRKNLRAGTVFENNINMKHRARRKKYRWVAERDGKYYIELTVAPKTSHTFGPYDNEELAAQLADIFFHNMYPWIPLTKRVYNFAMEAVNNSWELLTEKASTKNLQTLLQVMQDYSI